MILARRAGAALLAVVAIAVWFLMAPEEPKPVTVEGVADRSAAINSALSDYELNDLTASSAPQQQVVNGWIAKDLLTIIAQQQNDATTRDQQSAPVAPSDDRIPALAVLLVLGLALALVTTPRTEGDAATSRRSESMAGAGSYIAPPATV
jgi:hypothetical protein